MNMRGSRGFAMIEIVMATAIVGGLAVAALSLAATSAGHKVNAANVARGRMLCRSLAEEISSFPVADWSAGGLDIGIEDFTFNVSGTDATAKTVTRKAGSRSLYSVIDHYDGYTETPPRDQEGNAIAGYSGWTRTVSVQIVAATDPNLQSASETGLRRITVQAIYADKAIAETTFLRSSEWERVQP